jgi:hypothetical protein
VPESDSLRPDTRERSETEAVLRSTPPHSPHPRRRRRVRGRPGLISTATRIYKAAGKSIAAGVNRSFPELAWLRPRKADGILKAPMGRCPR